MRTLILLGWLLVPVLAGAYHYGPGQEQMRLDDVTATLAAADAQAAAGDYASAVAGYDQALALLPEERVAEIRRVQLERAKARLDARQLVEAHGELKALMDELDADPQADAATVAGTREALANAQYYNTWLMRLEGLPKDEWSPEIEASRQNFRALAEDAVAEGDEATATRRQEDLESAIRLARMGLDELQGLPLPSQCQGCKSCKNGRKAGKKPGKSKNQGEKKPEDARGAGVGPPPDNSGQ